MAPYRRIDRNDRTDELIAEAVRSQLSLVKSELGRDIAVVAALDGGATLRELAEALNVSAETVRTMARRGWGTEAESKDRAVVHQERGEPDRPNWTEGRLVKHNGRRWRVAQTTTRSAGENRLWIWLLVAADNAD